MKNRAVKTVLAVSMAAAVVMGNASPAAQVQAAGTESAGAESSAELIPVPKEMSADGTELTVTDAVNIAGAEEADADAVRDLREFLDANGITVNEQADEADTTFILGEADDEIPALEDAKDRLSMSGADGLGDEGYVLNVDPGDSAGGTIVIEGKDGDGTFYGVQTLRQLAEVRDGKTVIASAEITDEPTMSVRGTIEGFYGNPWSHEDRISQIEFYGDMKMNTYIYAPKDDPYHREQWREPYPSSEMERMQELIDVSKENKVDFVFALSPGIDIQFDGDAGESDYQALVAKCQSLYDMGVRSFAIFFDDISNKDGVKQAELLNRFNKEFIQEKGDIKPLITVPTEYDSNAMGVASTVSAYTTDFAGTLDPSIKVLWTGTAVVPEGIDVANAQQVKSVYGDRMGIWWNYPCTDYIQNKLGLGPVYGLDKGLEDEVDFLVLNPMEHAELSKITLATGADFGWNTAAYEYQDSFAASIDVLYGELAPYMYTFADHSTRLVAGWASTGRADAPEVRELMDLMMSKVAKGEDASEEISALNEEFDSMILAADTLKAELPADQLSHCSGNLDKLKALGENDKTALQLFVEKNADNRNEDKIQTLTAQLQGNLSSLQSGKLVSEQTALAFITDVLDYNIEPSAAFKVSTTFAAPGEEIQLTNESSLSSTNLEWTMKGADIETSTEENPVISYAEEGIYTISLKASNRNGEDVAVKTNIITVSEEAKAEQTNLALNKTATASGYTASNEAPGKAVDGITSTKWCTTNYGLQWLRIDLGKTGTITEIIISHAEMGGEGSSLNTQAYRVEVSNDGQNWQEILRVENNSSGLTEDAVPVTQGRYVRLLIDEPTQGGDSAARIYEVEVRGLDKEITLPPVYTEKISTAVLEYAIELAERADTDGVVAAVKENFDTALKNARDVLAQVEAGSAEVTQSDVDLAWQNLIKAMQYLDFKAGDKSDLEKVIALADEMDSRLDDYLDAGKEAFTSALATAKEVYADGNAMQEEVNSAWQNLLNAMANLRLMPNKDLLEQLIIQAENLNESDYEVQSFAVMRFALAAAKEVYDNENATQDEVDASVSTLRNAVAKLTLSGGEQAGTTGGTGTSGITQNSQTQAGITADKNSTSDNTSAAGKTAVSQNSNAKSVKTGDTANVLPLAAAAAAAAVLAAGVLAFRRKRG